MLASINPYNGVLLKEYALHTSTEINAILEQAEISFSNFKNTPFETKAAYFLNCAEQLRIQKLDLATLITLEMGKPIQEAIAEVEKCAQVCEYYADNAEDFLSDEIIASDAGSSFVSYEPLGVILAIMPWNFPLWQVFRFAAPTLMAGNVAILKHASNVPQCAEAIEKIFMESGFPKFVFSNIFCNSQHIPSIIENPIIKAVTITGSEKAGASVASFAGKNIKKCVLELGGNDAFIVLPDANLEHATNIAAKSRLSNAGQSCIASKRFIIHEEVYDNFLSMLGKKIDAYTTGDPMESTTQLSCLARPDLAKEVHAQVSQCIEQGATLIYGSNHYEDNSSLYKPVILGNVNSGVLAYHEEIFGPVFSTIKFKTIDEAIAIANDSKYGLGGSVWSKNINEATRIARKIDSGAVFINGLVKSDPRLPFGGIKNSGYGRELSLLGIMEFVNAKTIWVGEVVANS